MHPCSDSRPFDGAQGRLPAVRSSEARRAVIVTSRVLPVLLGSFRRTFLRTAFFRRRFFRGTLFGGALSGRSLFRGTVRAGLILLLGILARIFARTAVL